MARALRKVAVPPGGKIDRLLKEADAAPLLLERDGKLYRLSRADDEGIWVGYEPEQVREALKSAAGSWKDLDADQLIADIHRAREEGSRPADRP
jgi:hypothetical protein